MCVWVCGCVGGAGVCEGYGGVCVCAVTNAYPCNECNFFLIQKKNIFFLIFFLFS